jgi:hypothetical protein
VEITSTKDNYEPSYSISLQKMKVMIREELCHFEKNTPFNFTASIKSNYDIQTTCVSFLMVYALKFPSKFS